MRFEVGARYKHVKRGTYYVLLGRAGMQISWPVMLPIAGKIVNAGDHLETKSFVVYRSEKDDALWVRPESEFLDGRFELVEHA